jgi:Flp pilus assembly pilin Flp
MRRRLTALAVLGLGTAAAVGIAAPAHAATAIEYGLGPVQVAPDATAIEYGLGPVQVAPDATAIEYGLGTRG